MVDRGRPLSAGDRVRVRADDPPVHNRAPRYVRGHSGEIVHHDGTYPVPEDVVTGVEDPGPEPVYSVRFEAKELWGSGRHSVTVTLWDRYLEPLGRSEPPKEP